MADSKLSQLTESAALTGAELVYVVQSGAQRRTTTGAISATAPGTDLTFTAATRTLASSTGADVALPLVTSTTAGLAPLSGGGTSNFLRADGTWAAPAGGGAGTDLTYDAATRTLASSTGADVILPVATTIDAGLESAADKTKLDSITVDSATLVRKFVRNNSGASIPKGSAVYQTGSSGTVITVALADASAEATASQTLGLTQETIANNANGYVVAVGELTGVNTSTLTEGQIVWLSETAGALTTTRPTQPAHGVICGYCVKQGSGASGILYVKIDNGLELYELHDVLISSPTAGQVLRRASDGLWKNAVLAAADISGLGTAATTATTDYAPAAQGVTGGNSHDHNGGDGAQIAYSSLSGLPTLPTGTNTGDQTLANTSNATSHTVTLSGSGGSLQLVEGSNVTFATSGNGSDGVLTISASVTGGGGGTVTSIGLVAPTGFSVSGSPVTTSGDITLAFAAGYSLPTTASQTSWDTAFTERRYWDGGETGLTASTGRTSLGLGGAAVLNVGTTAGTVAAGDDSRLTTDLTFDASTRLLSSSTGADATLPLVTSSTAGLAPLSGGGTTNFLRADGTWAAPAGGGGSTQSVYVVGNWIVPFEGAVTTGAALTANTIALYPFIVRRNVTINGLGGRVTTVAASSNLQLAVYASNSSNKVTGNVLAATGNLSGATATSVSGSVTAFTLQAGLIYWGAINSDGVPVMLAPGGTSMYFNSILGAASLADVFVAATSTIQSRTVLQTYGTWPDLTSITPTLVTGGSNALRGAIISLQVSALP